MQVVVIAVIENNQEEVLIAKRKHGQELEGLWEFPGGKCEPGETHEQCLVREVLEEINISIQVFQKLDDIIYTYPFGIIQLIAYRCKIISGEIQLRVHSDIQWVERKLLTTYSFPPANTSLLEKITQEQWAEN